MAQPQGGGGGGGTAANGNNAAVPMMANMLHGMIAPPITNKLKDGPIHWAVERGDLATTERLLDMQFSLLEQVGVDLLTPLHWAARRGHEEVTLLLVQRGADVDVKDKFMQTPAHWAAWNGHSRVLQVLLEHGSDVNARDTKHCTPLYNACYIGHPACVRLLLSFGADTKLPDDKGRPPLRVVCKWEYADHRNKEEIQHLLLTFKRPAVLAPMLTNPSTLSSETAPNSSSTTTTTTSGLYPPSSSSMVPSSSSPALLLGASTFGDSLPGMMFNSNSRRQQATTAIPQARSALRGSNKASATLLTSSSSSPSLLFPNPSTTTTTTRRASGGSSSSGLFSLPYHPGRALFSLTRTFFPFELATNDYAHRALDLLTTLLVSTCQRAVMQGALDTMPSAAERDFNDVDTYELLRFLVYWPSEGSSRDIFLLHLFGGQKAVGSLTLFKTTVDSILDKVMEVRSGVIHRFATYQKVRPQQVMVLLDLVIALAVLMGGGEGEEEDIASEAERLKNQLVTHTRSKRNRLEEMPVDLPASSLNRDDDGHFTTTTSSSSMMMMPRRRLGTAATTTAAGAITTTRSRAQMLGG